MDIFGEYHKLNRSALVFGYTGECGKELVKILEKANIFAKVILVGRRIVQMNLNPGFEQGVVDFDNLNQHTDIFQQADVVYCCMGTTRKKAGKDGFVKVDKDYILRIAELSKAGGCKHFNVISSMGSDKNNWFLYPRIKGEVEEALTNMNFERLSIFRPGFLLCHREESRPFEHFLVICLMPLIKLFPTVISVPTSTVAKAMVTNTVMSDNDRLHVFENSKIHEIAKGYE